MLSRPTVHAPARILAAAAAALCLVLLASCSTEGAGDDEAATDPAPTSTESSAPTEPTEETPEPAAEGACEYPSDGMPPSKQAEAPPVEPVATDVVPVEIATSAGSLNAELDGAATPCTVNSFLSLAGQNYFNDTECHRLTTEGIFVLQCGDPTATGTGGPGYSFADELSGDETYPAGTLAMANAGPDTNGSQFFVVYEDTQLPPAYAVFGQLDAPGTKVVQQIAEAGTEDGGPDGAPAETVTIETVTGG